MRRTYRKFKLLTKFVFHGHDDFYVVQGIQTEIVDEVRLHGHLQLKSGVVMTVTLYFYFYINKLAWFI